MARAGFDPNQMGEFLRLMEKFSITSLLVYEKDYDNSVPQGLIHIHDLIKTGIG